MRLEDALLHRVPALAALPSQSHRRRGKRVGHRTPRARHARVLAAVAAHLAEARQRLRGRAENGEAEAEAGDGGEDEAALRGAAAHLAHTGEREVIIGEVGRSHIGCGEDGRVDDAGGLQHPQHDEREASDAEFDVWVVDA